MVKLLPELVHLRVVKLSNPTKTTIAEKVTLM